MKRKIEFNRKKNIRKCIFVLFLVVLVWNVATADRKSEGVKGFSLKEYVFVGMEKKVMETILPFASFQTEEKRNRQENLFEEMILQQTPFLLYATSHENMEEIVEEKYFYELLLKEQEKGNGIEKVKNIEDEEAGNLLAAMEAENLAAKEVMAQGEDVSGNDSELAENETEAQETAGEETENAVNMQQIAEGDFQKVQEKQHQYDWSSFPDTESIIKEFYTIDSTTSASAANINIQEFLNKDLTIDKNAEGYQILIFHTHSQEAFADSVPGDESTTIVGAGDRLTEILTNEYGYKVLHHKGEYDVGYRDDAYSKALPAIEQVLQEHPEIQVVIDLHRDAVAEGTKLVTEIQGRPTAKFMFFNGLSYTNQTGAIGYLENPNLSTNLAFSFQMQAACNEYFPGLTRKIYLKGYRYNMHLKDKYLLVEMGAQTNTVEEIMNACDPLAQTLDMVLSGVVY
ncbi:MAG: stage II sporulation protein P [Lachnospiraceae bacterium]|nr:stage II sporulation protein P [Lachnospiraceae bacterium]